jgi:type IV secretory pathway TraG/TraD family ATPase VirD4
MSEDKIIIVLSKALGNKTVMSGSISRGKNDPSQSLQMIQRPLMTPDELKTLPKGRFILAKTGYSPMITTLKRGYLCVLFIVYLNHMNELFYFFTFV